MSDSVEKYWQKFCQKKGIGESTKHEVFSFGYTSEMADTLGALVLKGIKTGTSSGYALYEVEGECLPQIGEYSIVVDSKKQPLCVIKNKDVKVLPFHEVGMEEARKEGEGDLTLVYWRNEHLKYFNTTYQKVFGRKFRVDDLIVFEEFTVVS